MSLNEMIRRFPYIRLITSRKRNYLVFASDNQPANLCKSLREVWVRSEGGLGVTTGML